MEILISAISIVLGGWIGFLISNHFHKKNEMFVRDMNNLLWSMEVNILQSKYPNLFTTKDIFIKDYQKEGPSNSDIPHIEEVRSESNIIVRGTIAKILIRFADSGRNLWDRGIEIRNDLNNYRIPLFAEGFGWDSFNLEVPKDAPLGSQKITISMEDRIGNKNKQVLDYIIIEN